MKTATIKLLKKPIFLVELPEKYDLEWMNDEKYIQAIFGGNNYIEELLGKPSISYTLLGKPNEIKEEHVMELVEDTEFKGIVLYWDYINERWFDESMGATESLLSAIESEIYWDVNPFESKADSLVSDNSANGCALYRKAFHEFCEAQEKTFDKSRTLIFVKN